GLEEKVAGGPAKRLDGVPVEGGGEDDGRQGPLRRPRSPEEAERSVGGELHVEEEDVQRMALQELEPLLAVLRLGHAQRSGVHLLDQLLQPTPRERLVLTHRLAEAHGRDSSTRHPGPESHSSEPPSAARRIRTVRNPRPSTAAGFLPTPSSSMRIRRPCTATRRWQSPSFRWNPCLRLFSTRGIRRSGGTGIAASPSAQTSW